MAANGGPHDFATLPWAEDIAKRAPYLRAQNCMMQAIGPCDFSPAELARFAEDPKQWGLRSGWVSEGAPKREPMPALGELMRAAELICGPDGADIAGLLQRFAAAWDAYQTEVQQVFSLWKGWMGPRAKSAPERDFGLEMLAAYADLHEACRQALPSVERMTKTIAAFARIAGRYGSGKPFQSGFLQALDVLSPQEHERRRLQSQAARDARGERGGSFDLGRSAQVAFDEEPYCAIGTFDDYIRNPWRYPPDFFDRHVPWENDPSNRTS